MGIGIHENVILLLFESNFSSSFRKCSFSLNFSLFFVLLHRGCAAMVKLWKNVFWVSFSPSPFPVFIWILQLKVSIVLNLSRMVNMSLNFFKNLV